MKHVKIFTFPFQAPHWLVSFRTLLKKQIEGIKFLENNKEKFNSVKSRITNSLQSASHESPKLPLINADTFAVSVEGHSQCWNCAKKINILARKKNVKSHRFPSRYRVSPFPQYFVHLSFTQIYALATISYIVYQRSTVTKNKNTSKVNHYLPTKFRFKFAIRLDYLSPSLSMSIANRYPLNLNRISSLFA